MARQYQLKKGARKGVSGIDYQAELNEQQYAAVSSRPGPALVIAGAGSGKTRTLTYRVAYLLDQGVDPKSLLLLTFTNKAAREMMERVRELIPLDLSELWSGTFHAIGNRILRRHADEAGLTSSFSIMDRDDQKSLMNTVVAECDIDTKSRRFPKADVLISIFSLIENTGVNLEDLLEARYPYFEEWSEEIAKVGEAYTAKKLDTNSVDFDDLLILPLKLLKENEDLRSLYQKRFQYLLVDEYQDTNAVQSELIHLLAQPQNSVMVVGDDAQSIYSWRGADMDNILSFPDHYPDATVYKIETNYRSVPEVIDLSNAAISANKKQFKKALRAARKGGSMTPALVPVEDPRAQADFVAQRVLELRDEGIELDEMAILYRAHHQSLEIQMELTARGIPFEITSGLRFFEQAHIKDVAAFLRFATNRRDEVSFKRFCLLLPGIGAATATKLWRAWLKVGISKEEKPPESFSDHMLKFPVPAKAKKDWEQLCYTLDELVLGDGYARPSEMLSSILEGVYDDYMKVSFENYDNRRQDIEQLILYSESFDDVLELLGQLSLMSSVDGEPTGSQAEPDDEKVVLSSIHQAKGLEWKVVFLIWLADGMFPNGRVLEADDQDMFEEERRLFYVALTRSKDELYLTYPQINPKSYTGDIITRPSRFLEDCPEEMLETWEVGPAW
ncbi:ATP-dependent helicase [bacterium]|nr:ATP-dependent helicase [Akkermansiaceae bacterium]MDB4526702.1 ATP-dependent helicase [bacterium]